MNECFQQRREPRWVPYIWLAYLIFFLWEPFTSHYTGQQWAWTGVGLVLFLFLYFTFFRSYKPWSLLCIAGIGLLGVVYAPFNSGAANFFIYSASMVPFAVETELSAALVIAAVVAVAGLEGWLLHLSHGFTFPAMFLSTFIGGGNIFFAQRTRHIEKLRRAHDEIEHLAKIAERERIARDLHDVLGHTLSLITLKSELARKLVDRDPERAKQEMQDVENTSRAALADVREAIRGYRTEGIFAELARARAALETAGVAVECDTDRVALSPAQESVLSLALREAVTNVVRHADASRCNVTLRRYETLCTLEIADDGCGANGPEGNGLRGMRERLEALGGSLRLLTSDGTRLIIDLPLASAASTLRN